MSEPLLIVGNGMASARLVDELAKRTLGRYAIAVVGEEPCLAYNRVLLSSVLAREVSRADIELKPASWWRDRGVTLLYGRRAVEIDPANRRLRLADGVTLPYANLVLATGSVAIRLDIPGADFPGVLTFRDLGDVASIEAASAIHKNAVVIGGGLLGLEAAYGLAKAGLNVSVVHLMDRLMERQLDERAAAMLKRSVERKGIKVHLNAETEAIVGSDHAQGIVLKDGRRIDCDLVVVATGIRANSQLAHTAGLDVGRGIVVNDQLQTSDSHIYSIGECAEHRGVCYGLVEPAYDQARELASHFSGSSGCYTGSILATNLKVSGIDVFSAGDFVGQAGTEQILFSDPGLSIYKKLVIAEGKLVGAVLFGDTADGLWYLDMIRSGAPIGSIRDDIMFGRALLESRAA